MKEDQCLVQCIHEEIIQSVTGLSEQNENLENLAHLFKVLGDYTRVRIIYALSQSEMCVCDLAYILKMSQSSISHQLRLLRQNKIVKKRREGKMIFYSLMDAHVNTLFEQGFAHVQHKE